MLKQQHFELAAKIFGTEDFDRLFVVHALAAAVQNELADELRAKRVYLLTVDALLDDLWHWYKEHDGPAGLRHALTGDHFHLLFGHRGVKR